MAKRKAKPSSVVSKALAISLTLDQHRHVRLASAAEGQTMKQFALESVVETADGVVKNLGESIRRAKSRK